MHLCLHVHMCTQVHVMYTYEWFSENVCAYESMPQRPLITLTEKEEEKKKTYTEDHKSQ